MGGFIACLHSQVADDQHLDRQLFIQMNHLLAHRGDDEKLHLESNLFQFGVRTTFSVVEDKVCSPFFAEDQRYQVLLTGKIYNIDELRKNLSDRNEFLQMTSQVEIVMNLYHEFKEDMIHQLRGMFSFVIWDKEEKTLFGARDPFGIKPLFYNENDKWTLFATEKKSILLALEEMKLDTDALQQYMTYQFVPEPKTMTTNIQKLEPGHYFIKNLGEPMEMHQYWKATFQPVEKSDGEYIHQIKDVLSESIQLHMQGNENVGSFLSGGIDSSIIVAIAKDFDPNLKTFSVGFEREGFSEIDVAQETAYHLGVENISYIISPKEYMEELPKILWYMDDPLADPACVPLYFVAREAKKHVNIVMSGEGADELFGGYNIYREPQSLEVFRNLPDVLKSFLLALAKMIPDGVKGKSFIERGVTPLEERYIGNAKIFSEKEKKNLLLRYNGSINYTDITKPLYADTKSYDPVERMQYVDVHTWLRGDILLKADRMTAAHSLEVRVPFLDRKVFEVASKLPTQLKTGYGTTKYILRKAVEEIVPNHVLYRKKLGFPVPIRHWLKNEMYDWVNDIIQNSGTEHLINKQYILNMLDEHCLGKIDYSRKIWTVIVFMIWHAVYIEEQYDFQKGVSEVVHAYH